MPCVVQKGVPFVLVYIVNIVILRLLMADTAVISVRLPAEKVRRIKMEAQRLGRRVSQVAADFIEEGFRRRDFPMVDLRDTAAGRVAYLKGTRLAVHWVAGRIRAGEAIEAFARDYELPVDRVRAALAYADAFPNEMAIMHAYVAENRNWIQQQDASWQAARPARQGSKRRTGRQVRR